MEAALFPGQHHHEDEQLQVGGVGAGAAAAPDEEPNEPGHDEPFDEEPEQQQVQQQVQILPFQQATLVEMKRLESNCTGSVVTTFGWLANPSGCGKTVTMAAYLNERGSLRVPYVEKNYTSFRSTRTTNVAYKNLAIQQSDTYSLPFNPTGLPETPATLWVCSSFELSRVRFALRTFAPDIRSVCLRRLTDVKRLLTGTTVVTSTTFHEDHLVELVERRIISVVVVLDSFLANYRRVFQHVAWNRIVVNNIFRNKTILNAFTGDDFIRRFLWVLQGAPEYLCTSTFQHNVVSRVSLPNTRLGVFDMLQKSGTLGNVILRTINYQIIDDFDVTFERTTIPSASAGDLVTSKAAEKKCVQQRADKILHDISFTNHRNASQRAWLVDNARRSLDFLNIRGMQTVDDVQAFLAADVESCIAQGPPEDILAHQGRLARLLRPRTEPLECPVCLMSEGEAEAEAEAVGESEDEGEGEGGSEDEAEGEAEPFVERKLGKKFVTICSCHHNLCSTCCAILVSRTCPTVCPSCRQDFNAMHVVVSTEDVEAEANTVDALRQLEISTYGRVENRQDRIVRTVRTILAEHSDANVIVTLENVEQTRHNLLYDLPFTDEELERVWIIGLCDTSFLLDASVSAPPGISLCDATHVVSCFPLDNPYAFERTLGDFCMGYKKTIHIVEIH